MTRKSFFKWWYKHRHSSGGTLRRKRLGRKARPLYVRHPVHLVFKANLAAVPKGLRHPVTYTLIIRLVRRYSRRFRVKVEQISIQRDHIHLLIRASRKSRFHAFFRVVAGQFAQRVTDTFTRKRTGPAVWVLRPFTRVVLGWRAYATIRDYIQLNEKEARGEIRYQKRRLKGLTPEQIQSLWRPFRAV